MKITVAPMPKQIVILSVWYVDEVDRPEEIGWYHVFYFPGPDPLAVDSTMEVGPFPSEAAARADALLVALSVPNWDIRNDPLENHK